jgi:hypothetical protein
MVRRILIMFSVTFEIRLQECGKGRAVFFILSFSNCSV